MGFNIGKPNKPKQKGSEPTPSNKEGLGQGIPTYTGDTIVDMDSEEPITILVMSEEGNGKTHCAYTFPEPAHCDTEMKGERIWKKFYKGIHQSYRMVGGEVEPYTWDQSIINPTNSRLKHAEDWGGIASFYEQYIEDSNVQTLIFDSETDMREYAELWWLRITGKKTAWGGEKAGRMGYAEIFGMLRHVFKMCKRSNKNVVYCARVAKEYHDSGPDKGNPTGRMVHKGYNEMPYFVDYVIYLQYGVQDSKGRLLYKDHLFGEVRKCANMQKNKMIPYLIECNYKGVVQELVRGSEWTKSKDEFIAQVIEPAMKGVCEK